MNKSIYPGITGMFRAALLCCLALALPAASQTPIKERVWARLPVDAWVTDLQAGELRVEGQLEVAATTRLGAFFFSPDGSRTHTVRFAEPQHRAVLMNLGQPGRYGFLGRGGWDTEAAALTRAGDILWTYSAKASGTPYANLNDTAWGDLNGDGTLEFAFGFNGADGVHLRDMAPRPLWAKKDANVWRIAILPDPTDGVPRIYHSNAAGRLIVRNANGTVHKTIQPETYFSAFEVISWPEHDGAPHFLCYQDGSLWLFDHEGATVRRYPTGLSATAGNVTGTAVRLSSTDDPYLAAVVFTRRPQQQILHIYNHLNQLIHRRELPEETEAIGVLPTNGSRDILLVGGRRTIWAMEGQ